MAKIFGKSQGRAHFPGLDSRDFDTNAAQSIFINVDANTSIEDVCEPSSWGPQPRLVRGTILRALRVDDAWFGEFICVGCSAGYPQFKIVKVAELRPAAAQSTDAGSDGVKFLLGVGHVVVLRGEVVAARSTREEAEAAFAEHLAKAAA